MPQRNYDNRIAQQLQIQAKQVTATVALLDEGNTLPFIARYRKEMTGGLDELKLRAVSAELTRLRKLDDRRDTILATIEEQGQLTPELAGQIKATDSLTELEDLYQPYKRKRRTRATTAQENGLTPLAEIILSQPRDRKSATDHARAYITDNVPNADTALAGARDIIAERISDHPQIRGQVREKALEYGTIIVVKIKNADDPRETYAAYYDFRNRVSRVRPHQTLAFNRGESEKILRVKLGLEERDWLRPIQSVFRPDNHSPLAEQLELAIHDAAKRLLLPAIERDVRRTLTETAEAHAITVFADNLRGLLNTPPLADQTVIGLDPGYRTGCKVALVDPTGKVLATDTIYPHLPQKRYNEALKTLAALLDRHNATLIAVGNGTASRETEQLAADLTRNRDDVQYLIVNEAGASVYSASELARAELPGMDVSLRGAVSIARRVQDPLAELVKIDPRSVGVGLYQHDVNQTALSEAAEAIVESVVNQVGVEANTASPALLAYVAGIGPKLADNIVAYRDENGPFRSRAALKQVPGLGPKSFEQAAGFLRVRDSKNLLDASAIHPESYAAAKSVMERAKITAKTPPTDRETALNALRQAPGVPALADELGVGLPTLQDILEQLARPGRDPREDAPTPILRSDVLSMDDLTPGMILNGTVRNVVDFGAFIDIGVKQDGLLHISQVPRGQSLSVGDVLEVKIRNVDQDRGRIGLGWVD
jgi:protein Tex